MVVMLSHPFITVPSCTLLARSNLQQYHVSALPKEAGHVYQDACARQNLGLLLQNILLHTQLNLHTHPSQPAYTRQAINPF